MYVSDKMAQKRLERHLARFPAWRAHLDRLEELAAAEEPLFAGPRERVPVTSRRETYRYPFEGR